MEVSKRVMAIGTRYKDKYGRKIYVGDLLYVCEYPDKYVGGSLDEMEYYDSGSMFIRNYDNTCGLLAHNP